VPSTNISCTVNFGGKAVTGDEVHDVLVEADLDQPDHACVVLSNGSTRWSEQVNEGDDIEIKLGFAEGSQVPTVFKGEVTGIEPIYDSRSPARVVIRGLNQLHRLTRGKKSVAHKQVTDKDIVDKVCQSYGLTAKYGDAPPSTKYEHVYQHNMTDLEFIKLRAARIGFEVFVNDKELNFRKRNEADSGLKLEFGLPGDSALEKFMPRLSTANQVSEVRVYGWDPDKKKEIVGSAKPQSSKLGDKTGTQVAEQKHKNVLQVQVESPVSSKEEADNIAKSVLQERLMHFITGDGVCKGNPQIKPGIIVTVNVQDKRFNGKYYITAIRHRYVHAGATGGGFRTEFKFRRDAKSQ
jgi:phage protein D